MHVVFDHGFAVLKGPFVQAGVGFLIITALLVHGLDLVRINAMIIATQLTNPEADQLIDVGLSDENAAVQYWGELD